MAERVPAGFPSPAEGQIDQRLNLNDVVVRNPTTTFFVRVTGDSMAGAGIDRGDLLVVDRALEARDGQVVVARLSDEYTVKRLRRRNGRVWLVPENPAYSPRDVTEEPEFEVWGVATYAVRSLLRAWPF